METQQRCPLWVISRHLRCNGPCRLYARKQASGDAAKCGQNTASGSLEVRCVTPTPKPKIPLTIWVMLGAVILFALLISYFLVVGVYDITARGLS
jgi:hypothetical protein